MAWFEWFFGFCSKLGCKAAFDAFVFADAMQKALSSQPTGLRRSPN
ncbi:hypothetical protein D1AOALGA4SA_13145 [Olavius algarvensis Delta 1 endosymbiont]|nr:hypothetical protein D1AOALGA4SA_13145 [Olavius algarvensis Delta 1 endosymbiont]